MTEDPELTDGWIDYELALEFPELQLRFSSLPVRPRHNRKSPPEIQERLRVLSGRFHGAQAITMRRDPIPHAYRVFFRAIGLDPDTTRTPIEAVALQRLWEGGFVSRGHLPDALVIALVETGVPVWAIDDARVDGPLGVRPARVGERLGTGPYAHELESGRLVVADAVAPVALLFGDLAPAVAPTDQTRAVCAFSVRVAGVPQLAVEEALWLCAEALDAP